MTLQDMMTMVGDHFDRDDIARKIARNIIFVYRTIAAKVQWDELMEREEFTIGPLSTTISMDLAANRIGAIQWVTLTDSAGNRRKLTRSISKAFDSRQTLRPGIPSQYSRFNNTMEFDATPLEDLTVTIAYAKRLAIDVMNPENVELELPEEWEELVFWESVSRTALDLKEFELHMMLNQGSMLPDQAGVHSNTIRHMGIIPRLWNDLLSTTSANEFTDAVGQIAPARR